MAASNKKLRNMAITCLVLSPVFLLSGMGLNHQIGLRMVEQGGPGPYTMPLVYLMYLCMVLAPLFFVMAAILFLIVLIRFLRQA